METQKEASSGPEATAGTIAGNSEPAADGRSKIELIEEALLKNVGGGTCYHQTCYYGHVCYHQTCYHQTCYFEPCYYYS